MNRFLKQAAFIAALAIIFAGCNDDPKDKDFTLNPSSMNLIVGETSQINLTPATETYSFESTVQTVATVNQTGLISAVGAGNTVIRVTLGTVTKEVAVSVAQYIPIETINVSETSVSMLLGGESVTIETTLLPENYEVPDDTLEWESEDENVARVVNGIIEPVGVGTTTITVRWVSNPEVKAEITVEVVHIPKFIINGIEFSLWEHWTGNTLHANMPLQNGQELILEDLALSMIEGFEEQVYNRDFMAYNPTSGKYTFTGESGLWDLFYSDDLKYFWINKWDEPDGYWITGNGFWSSTKVFDYDIIGWGCWDFDDPKLLAYLKPIGNEKFQAHIYISDDDGWYAEMQFYYLRGWDNVVVITEFVGIDSGMILRDDYVFEARAGIVAGYYRVELDVAAEKVTFTKIN